MFKLVSFSIFLEPYSLYLLQILYVFPEEISIFYVASMYFFPFWAPMSNILQVETKFSDF